MKIQTRTMSFLNIIFGLMVNIVMGQRCERISSNLCQNLGYNSTLMPNFMGHDNQINADLGLKIYEPLINHDCSKNIRLLICSVFVPMCSEQVPEPIPACRGLCEKVRDDCRVPLQKIGLEWPSELNCSSFPVEDPQKLCIKPPLEEDDEPITPYPSDDISLDLNCPPNSMASEGRCIPLCITRIQNLGINEITTFEICVAVSSIIGLVFTTFALITFIIQPKRFRWPARPILYLTSCGFVTCTIYLIRWIEGPYSCAGNLIHEKPSESLSCVGISLILLFCDIAYTLWWTVFCFVWFLSAMKEWSTEAIEKISTRLHALVWIFSAVPMFYVLFSNNISINHLSGFCEVSNNILVFFQMFFMVLSTVLLVLTSVALKNVERALSSAGSSPVKLRRLFYRLLIISLGISVPYCVYLLCQFYDTFAMVLTKLILRKTSIIFATLWVYSPKTLDMWQDLLCFKKKSYVDTQNPHNVSSFPMIFGTVDQSKAGSNLLAINTKNIVMYENKRTIFDIFFASTAEHTPVTRV